MEPFARAVRKSSGLNIESDEPCTWLGPANLRTGSPGDFKVEALSSVGKREHI